MKIAIAVCEACCNGYGVFAFGKNAEDAKKRLWTRAKKEIKHFWNTSDPDYPRNYDDFADYYGVNIIEADTDKPETMSGSWEG